MSEINSRIMEKNFGADGSLFLVHFGVQPILEMKIWICLNLTAGNVVTYEWTEAELNRRHTVLIWIISHLFFFQPTK